MALKNVSCTNCGTQLSFTVDSEIIETETDSDMMVVKEEGTGGMLSPGNYTRTGVEWEKCPDCDMYVSILTDSGYQDALDDLGISDDEAITKTY